MKNIPEYLRPFITEQDPNLYTPIDHASWRYIMRLSQAFFKDHAHPKYLDGLKETGISVDRIPLISEMNEKLSKFGWGAVGVSGFIPPSVFLEFISLGLLPIACDMRSLEHLAYTPAPDIVHEAAGHAPIVADPEYAAYLKNYGEISRRAIFSKQDLEVYEAIRNLSDTKENPTSSKKDIDLAQKRLDQALASIHYTSEATLLARMSWWTIEYGLVGSFSQPLIYGAGLLSSVGESYQFNNPEVKKIPFTLDSIYTSYDITKPQPQLFVTPDFQKLTDVLEELADTMAYRKGGLDGLAKAKMAETVNTAELDSGLQISGILTEVMTNASGIPIFMKFLGPSQLSYKDSQLSHQGPDYHKDGYSTPIGYIKNSQKSAGLLRDEDLKKGLIEFESGIILRGKFKNRVIHDGKTLILVFEECTLTYNDTTLYRPEWGPFDLACGAGVVSVYGGAGDRAQYLLATGGYKQKPLKQKSNLTEANRELNELYFQVRRLRESSSEKSTLSRETEKIIELLNKKYPNDWLLRMELLELNSKESLNAVWAKELHFSLEKISNQSQEIALLIKRGLSLLKTS